MSRHITFQSNNGKISITLPPPEIGDSITVDGNVRLKRDYNCAIHTFKTSPNVKTFKLSFTAMQRYKFYEVRAFLISNAGFQFTYIDLNNESWKVKCTDEEVDMVTKRGGPLDNDGKKEEYFDVELNLEIQPT
jgi:hypothetical protein